MAHLQRNVGDLDAARVYFRHVSRTWLSSRRSSRWSSRSASTSRSRTYCICDLLSFMSPSVAFCVASFCSQSARFAVMLVSAAMTIAITAHGRASIDQNAGLRSEEHTYELQ